MAVACFVLAAVILAISMPHLKAGAVKICRCTEAEGWLIAVVFDLAQLLAEAALLLAPGVGVRDC